MLKKLKATTTIITTGVALLSMISFTTHAVDLHVTYPNNWDSSWEGGTFENYNYQAPLSKHCTKYSFTVCAQYCYCRKKTDYSSVYVYNKSGKDAKVDVFAANKMGGGYNNAPDATTASVNYSGPGSVNCRDIKIGAHQERKIYQYIKENRACGGGAYAHMHFKTPGTSGVWSPDCSGEWLYSPAN